MELSRRTFLVSVAGLAASGAIGEFYLNNELMEKPPVDKIVNGKKYVLADLHVHVDGDIAKNNPGSVVDLLSSGLTAMTEGRNHVLNYDQALELCAHNGATFREIERGLLAEVIQGDKKGYVLRAQEVYSSHHILSVGCTRFIDPSLQPERVVEEIRKYGGISILVHPYILNSHGGKLPRIANSEEEKMARSLAQIADEIEIFNGHCIDLAPSTMLPTDMKYAQLGWLKRMNERARKLADSVGKKGIASSDAHDFVDQAKTSGIYVPESNLSIASLQEAIATGDFMQEKRYISRWSFLKSRFYELPVGNGNAKQI